MIDNCILIDGANSREKMSNWRSIKNFLLFWCWPVFISKLKWCAGSITCIIFLQHFLCLILFSKASVHFDLQLAQESQDHSYTQQNTHSFWTELLRQILDIYPRTIPKQRTARLWFGGENLMQMCIQLFGLRGRGRTLVTFKSHSELLSGAYNSTVGNIWWGKHGYNLIPL